jgi:hypothetical protein
MADKDDVLNSIKQMNRLDYEKKLPGAKSDAEKRGAWDTYRKNAKALDPQDDIPEYDKAPKMPGYSKGGLVKGCTHHVNKSCKQGWHH